MTSVEFCPVTPAEYLVVTGMVQAGPLQFRAVPWEWHGWCPYSKPSLAGGSRDVEVVVVRMWVVEIR